MVWGPTAVGGSLTVQLVVTTAMESVVVHDAVQLAKAVLERSAVKLTVPVGAVAEPGVASVTVAVQLVGLPTGTLAGEQLTAVLVSCLRAVTTKVPELLRWLASPL